MTAPAAMTNEPRIEVVLGRCDDMRAEVFVRATGLADVAEGVPVVSGTLTGPESRSAITLPTKAMLTDLGPGPDGSALARTILTEPGYWTPELPHRYRLVARIAAGSLAVAACDRLVGLRRLGVRGRSLWLEGRRWVPRGIVCDASAFDAPAIRDLHAAAVIDDPPEAVCAAADATGVAIIARCSADPVASCLRWSDHASVMLAVLPRGMETQHAMAAVEQIQRFKGTMLLAVEVDATQPPDPVASGVDFLVLAMPDTDTPHRAWRDAAPSLPLVAARPAAGTHAERRRACDRLQADLASWRGDTPASWDWAGYIAS